MIKCIDCKFIRYDNGGLEGQDGPYYECIHNFCFKWKVLELLDSKRALYGSKHIVTKERETDYYNLNKDNNCCYYKRKWWKFWV